MVEQETRKEQAEEHHETANEVGHTAIAEHDANEQADGGRGKVEEHQHQHESKELGPGWDQPGHGVDNDAHDDGRDQSERDNIEHHLGSEVCDRMVVTIGTFAHEQEPFRGEDRETRQGTKAEQRQDEEEQAQTVLETLDVIGQSIEEVPGQDSQKDGDSVVGEHQHRIAIEVAPGALRENDELTGEADAGIAHRRSRGGAIDEM